MISEQGGWWQLTGHIHRVEELHKNVFVDLLVDFGYQLHFSVLLSGHLLAQ